MGGTDDDFLGEIIGIFLTDMPMRIAELENGLRGIEADKFMRAAHSIKGSAANMGALALGAAAQALEAESKLKPLDQMTPLLEALKAEYARAAVELKKLAT